MRMIMSAFHMSHPTAALYRKFNIIWSSHCARSVITNSNLRRSKQLTDSDSRDMGVNESVKSIHSRDSTICGDACKGIKINNDLTIGRYDSAVTLRYKLTTRCWVFFFFFT